VTTSFPIGPIKGQYVYIPDQDNAVYTEHIRDGAVTNAKLDGGIVELLTLLSTLPTEDPQDGVTIWNNSGVLQVASAP
jgi:hypothetical protein